MALLDGIDLTKPCLVWPQLHQAYLQLLAGDIGGVARVKFRDREVEFNKGNLKDLAAEIARLQALCLAGQGARGRFAIRAGFRRAVVDQRPP